MKGTQQHVGLTHVTVTSGKVAGELFMIFLMQYTLNNDQIGATGSNLTTLNKGTFLCCENVQNLLPIILKHAINIVNGCYRLSNRTPEVFSAS